MLKAVAVILGIALAVWLIQQAARRKPIKAHWVMYGLSSATGIFTLVFFLRMDIPKMVKVLVCIVLGAILIFLAAWLQRRREIRKPG